MAKRLTSRLHTDDIAGRLGGDEFIVIINHLGESKKTAVVEAEKIASQLIKSSYYLFNQLAFCFFSHAVRINNRCKPNK
jgi:GGDEF domain-containing protein